MIVLLRGFRGGGLGVVGGGGGGGGGWGGGEGVFVGGGGGGGGGRVSVVRAIVQGRDNIAGIDVCDEGWQDPVEVCCSVLQCVAVCCSVLRLYSRYRRGERRV